MTETQTTTKKTKEAIYFAAVGRRKSSVAQVRIYESKKEGGKMTVNGKDSAEYFSSEDILVLPSQPLELVGKKDDFFVSVVVRGGGFRGQAEAIRLGVARALIKYDSDLRSVLKSAKFFTRDARSVERKKPGLKKARRAPQWSKR